MSKSKITKDEEIVIFHYRLGVAITQWSAVENLLGAIVLACFDNAKLNHEALGIGMFSLETFRPKLAFADGVVSRKLADSVHLADWKAIVGRARTLSTSRNKLSHWGMQKFWRCEPGRRVALIPWVFKKPNKKTRVPRPPAGSLCILDIVKISAEFLALANSMLNFHHRAGGRKEPLQKSDEQANHPPSVDTLARQIRVVFSPPPQS